MIVGAFRKDGYETIHGGFSYGKRNSGGVSILVFAVAYKLSLSTHISRKRKKT